MKYVLAPILVTSTLFVVGCDKTNKPALTTTENMEVDVTVDGNEIIVMVNGEERDIDLSELFGEIDLENMDSEVSVAVMAYSDDDEHAMRRYQKDGDNVEFHWIAEGDDFEGKGGEIMKHVKRMMGGEGGNHEMRMRMMGGEGSEHEMQRVRVMRMHGDSDNRRGGHDNDGGPHEMHGEWKMDNDVPEEVQFMQELSMLNEVAHHLEERDSVAVMGIHMIRDSLEGEIRMSALTTIIEEAPNGSVARNAALFVAIQSLQEDGENEAAAELMVELVLSN